MLLAFLLLVSLRGSVGVWGCGGKSWLSSWHDKLHMCWYKHAPGNEKFPLFHEMHILFWNRGLGTLNRKGHFLALKDSDLSGSWKVGGFVGAKVGVMTQLVTHCWCMSVHAPGHGDENSKTKEDHKKDRNMASTVTNQSIAGQQRNGKGEGGLHQR